MPQVDLSPLLISNQSDMFIRDITGKVNPNGQTLGKTVSTVTGAVIPIVIGGVVKPVSPKTLKSLGTLAEAEMVEVNLVSKVILEINKIQDFVD